MMNIMWLNLVNEVGRLEELWTEGMLCPVDAKVARESLKQDYKEIKRWTIDKIEQNSRKSNHKDYILEEKICLVLSMTQ